RHKIHGTATAYLHADLLVRNGQSWLEQGTDCRQGLGSQALEQGNTLYELTRAHGDVERRMLLHVAPSMIDLPNQIGIHFACYQRLRKHVAIPQALEDPRHTA